MADLLSEQVSGGQVRVGGASLQGSDVDVERRVGDQCDMAVRELCVCV